MMRQRRGRETISIERGPHPVESDCVLRLLLRRDENRAPARTPASPLETAKNHRVARKAAARQYLIPLLLSFSVSSFSSLCPFFFHWSLYSLLYSIPSTNSRGNPFSYSSYFTITISGSSRFSSPLPHSIRSLIKYIYLTTHTREHAHLIITRTDRIIPVRPQPIVLTTLYDIAFVIVFIFYEPINCYHALLNPPRIHLFRFTK